jgi:nucleoside transporter
MNSLKIPKMAVMMFLQFFCWGAWYGQMSKYLFDSLKASGDQVGNAYSAFSLAMIIAPFFVGMIADRYFSAQKVLAVLNILGSIILFFLIDVTDPSQFFWMILLYCITFAPTLALSSSIALKNIENPESTFPVIRVFGTIAWIVVTNIVGAMEAGGTNLIFKISMVVSLVLGLYSFFVLPDTPPSQKGSSSFADILGLKAFSMFKDPSFLVFFVSSVLICIPLSFYYSFANPSLSDSGWQNVENKMSLGQVSEVVFMLLIPLCFRKLGVKWMLIIGLIAWIIRFYFFGAGNASSGQWMFYLAILLHGVCFDFFFVTGQIYTDKKAGNDIKSSAQGLITLATYGLGMGIGSKLGGIIVDKYTVNEIKNWASIWTVPAVIAAVVLLIFLVSFKDNTVKENKVI